MNRLPAVVFVILAVATAGAFFFVQHLKVSTPLLAGFPHPVPAVIDPVHGGVCGGVDHRQMRISFYLLHRSDDVDVAMVTPGGQVVATLASDRYLRRKKRVRPPFIWGGREDDGEIAPNGTYYVQVTLIHQDRTVQIAPTSGGNPYPVRIDTVVPRPRVVSVSPADVTDPASARVQIRVSGNQGHPGLVEVYRLSAARPPVLVKTFVAGFSGGRAVWDLTIHGRPAPSGRYLVGLSVTNAACTTGRFPATLPAAGQTLAGATVTVG